MNQTAALARVFAYLSLLTVGGGMAAFPEMKVLTVDVHKWLTFPQLIHLYSVGQMAPGPNMMMIVSIGECAGGWLGALVTLVAFFGPTALLAFMVTWGIFAVLTGFVQSAPQLYAARFLLGVAEAGLGPGLLTYLSACFRQREQARMVAFVMAAIPASNVIGGPISGFVLDHVHWLALASWRWLLILEGLPPIVGGVITWFVLPNRPAEARFLTAEQKEWIGTALAQEEVRKAGDDRLSALAALVHPRVWHLAVISFTLQSGGYAMLFWMPQAVKSSFISYSNTLIGILLLIPYVASILTLLLVSQNSDRLLERRYHTVISLIVGGLALSLLPLMRSPWPTITLWTFCNDGAPGLFSPIFLAPGRLPDGSCRSVRNRTHHLGRLIRRVRRTFYHWSCRSSFGRYLPCAAYRCRFVFLIRNSHVDVAETECHGHGGQDSRTTGLNNLPHRPRSGLSGKGIRERVEERLGATV